MAHRDMETATEIVNFDEDCGHDPVQHYWSADHDRWFCAGNDDDDSSPCRCRGGDVETAEVDKI